MRKRKPLTTKQLRRTIKRQVRWEMETPEPMTLAELESAFMTSWDRALSRVLGPFWWDPTTFGGL